MTRLHDDHPNHAFATRAVHAGPVADPLSGAVMPPIYQTSTYAQEGLGRHKGYEYGRTHNPTRMAFERCIADLEGGAVTILTSSGLGAVSTALLAFVSAGDHILITDSARLAGSAPGPQDHSTPSATPPSAIHSGHAARAGRAGVATSTNVPHSASASA